MEPRRPPLVREAVLEGIFYPNSAYHLREAVRMLLLRCDELAANAPAIVSPHGSFQYSGMHQATAFKRAAAASPAIVGIIGATVRDQWRTPAVPESQYFRTPLGDTLVDTRRCRELSRRCSLIRHDDMPHLEEPSIETALPFIQFLFPEAQLLPVLLPNLSRSRLNAVATAVQSTISDVKPSDILWVCATNMSRGGNARSVRRKADTLLSHLCEGNLSANLPEARAGRGYPAATCLALLECVTGKAHGTDHDNADDDTEANDHGNANNEGFEVLTRGSSFDIDGNSGDSTEYAAVASRPVSEVRYSSCL